MIQCDGLILCFRYRIYIVNIIVFEIFDQHTNAHTAHIRANKIDLIAWQFVLIHKIHISLVLGLFLFASHVPFPCSLYWHLGLYCEFTICVFFSWWRKEGLYFKTVPLWYRSQGLFFSFYYLSFHVHLHFRQISPECWM